MPITQAEFERRMQEISKMEDSEVAHKMADDLLCEVLNQYGYAAGIRLFQAMDKWYS